MIFKDSCGVLYNMGKISEEWDGQITNPYSSYLMGIKRDYINNIILWTQLIRPSRWEEFDDKSMQESLKDYKISFYHDSDSRVKRALVFVRCPKYKYMVVK